MAIEDLRYIAIEGVIGAGKTSLTARLSQTIGAKAVYEEFEKNPFLEDFYNDPEHYAFQTQIFFLLSRYQQQQNLHQHDLFQQCIVSDYIFGWNDIGQYYEFADILQPMYGYWMYVFEDCELWVET